MAVAADGDVASPNSIEISWEAISRGKTLHGRVSNNTEEPLEIRLSAVAQSPRGDVVERSLGSRRLEPKASLPISMPIRELPSQSVGLASPTAIVAKYPVKRYNLRTGEVEAEFEATASSDPLLISFDEDFGEATFRTEQDEAKLNGRRSPERTATGRRTLRLYSKAQDAVSDVDTSDESGVQYVVEGGSLQMGTEPTLQVSPAVEDVTP